MLELLKLAKRYDGFTLALDLRVEDGVTVLFGPSGAGKTLTLDCVAGFVRPDEGRILLHEEILFDHRAGVCLPPRRRNCGYVFQNYALFPHMTLRENLRFARDSRPMIDEMLARFRLEGVAHRYPHELSGGQQQRGSIARALLTSPRILLLDEPARGLDATLRQDLYAVIRQVRRDFGTPVLMVTHDLAECLELGDRMVVMRQGGAVATGAPRDLLANPGKPEVAELFGCFNVFEAEAAALDPEKDTCRLRVGEDYLYRRHIPGCKRGDRVWFAIRTNALRAWPKANRALGPNQVAVELEHAAPSPTGSRLVFAGDLVVESADVVEGGEKDWIVEFPPEALIALRS